MPMAKIILGDQEFDCEAELRGETATYCGTLPSPIRDSQALSFWEAYENAVEGMMLKAVEILEQQMANQSFRVVVDDREYLGADVDLQVFPTAGDVSFTLPE